jgi:tRNA(Phe) wybutosine-synthesizing methylase Tyw3
MTQDQIELLRKLYDHGKWTTRPSEDGKTVVVQSSVDIATADEKEAAEFIVQIHNAFKALVEENARLKAQLGIRG